MKWIKTCSTMSEEWFSNLAVIVMYYSKRFAQIEVDEVEGMLFWEKDILLPKSLGSEVSRRKTLWQSTDRELPNNLLLAWGAWDEDTFPNIHHLLLIACTLLITSTEAEWSFSQLMKWIKTCSTMSEEWFSNLAVIVMYYSKRFAQIEGEVDKICQEALVGAHPRRPIQASLFDWIGR